MSRLRILVAVHGYPPTHAHGAERRAERTALALRDLGHDVSVLAVERIDAPTPMRRTDHQDAIPVHRLFYDVSRGDRWRNLYDHPFVGEACRAVLHERPVDVVHVISGYLVGAQAVSAARECGVRVVVTLTEFWFLCARLNLLRRTGEICDGPNDEKCARCLLEERRRYRLPANYAPALADAGWVVARHWPANRAFVSQMARRSSVLRATLATADLVISPSHFLVDTFNRHGFDTSAFLHMRQGIAPPPAALPPAPESRTLRLGYVGQLKAHKGVDLAVAAVMRLVDDGCPVTLDIWGDESDAPDYTRQLRAGSARVQAIRWNGRTDAGTTWKALAGIDALIVPSRWYENSPNVILEAFAAGVAVIATDLGGMAELVEPGVTGQLFALNSVDSLYGVLKGLVTDRALLRACRARGGRVRSVDDEAGELVRAYQRVLDGARPGSV